MNKNKTAPTEDVQAARAKVDGGISCNHYITAQESRQVCVSDYLMHGRRNATPARELSRILDWTPREVTRAIEAERRAGRPILACGRGYFLPIHDVETDGYLRSLFHREREVKKTRLAVEASRQQRMFDGGDAHGT